MFKSERFGLVLTPREKMALARIAEVEGELSQAAIVRRLIRAEAQRRGFWPVPDGLGDWREHWQRVLSEPPEAADGDE